MNWLREALSCMGFFLVNSLVNLESKFVINIFKKKYHACAS